MRSEPTIAETTSSGVQWSRMQIQENQAAVWTANALVVYVQKVLGDVLLARDESDTGMREDGVRMASSIPLHANWKRWTFGGVSEEVRFWPAFPDRALVVKTRMPVVVSPHSRVELYVNLPIWLEVSVLQKKDYFALDSIIPSPLSNTWFGTHYEGELCYAVESKARRSVADLVEEPFQAVCLMEIRNRSDRPLPVEKIRIDPSRLSLYRSMGRLWTGRVDVDFKGKDEHTELRYRSEVPEFLREPELIRSALQSSRRGSVIDRLLFRFPHKEPRF